MELVAFIGSDRENWGQVSALIKRGNWNRIILVKNSDAREFPDAGAERIEIDSKDPLIDLKKDLVEKLGKKIRGIEVALSIASGNGKEHMALISALLSIPAGVRLVAFTKSGLEYIN